MKTNIPYTYLIGWPDLDRWYYGVRYAKKCCPDDLWNPYKTSSKIVQDFILKHGDPPIKKIRKIFNHNDNAILMAQLWENRVLKRLKVVKKEKWLNGHDSQCFDPSLVPKGEHHWTKQSENAEKVRLWKEKLHNRKHYIDDHQYAMPSGDQHWTKKNSEAAKKHAERMNGIKNPNNDPQVKEKKSKYLKDNNPVNLPGVREKISKKLLGRKHPRKICEVCGKNIANTIYTRYHGSKCNHSNNKSI